MNNEQSEVSVSKIMSCMFAYNGNENYTTFLMQAYTDARMCTHNQTQL